uniref:Dihydroorotase n=1 Tax=Candidatus Methanogaster sp. ANME-2c ERB4 TaxID=2759911 RepID=A0A7G9YDX3_9EURY|nr:dihydroorotase [Methanosarcinales archaeon ANME-2c ERB4]
MPDLIIKDAKVLLNGSLQHVDIAIKDGRIVKVAKAGGGVSSGAEVINARGALTLPGVIDAHVHFRDPGLTHKEDWYTGSCAAAAGGVTTVIDQPNTAPPTLDKKSFNLKLKSAKRKSIIDFGINGGGVPSANLEELWSLGVTAFGEIFMADGDLSVSESELADLLKSIAELGGVASIHAENGELCSHFTEELRRIRRPEIYSRARPNICEAIAVERVLEMQEELPIPVRIHICHLSTREGVGVVRRMKYGKKEAGFTCEVAPHHLFLDHKDWARLGTFGKMNPPLRKRCMQHLWNGLNDGTIDIIASDHAPHTDDEKRADIWDAPAGVPGVETMLPLMLNAVKQNLIPLARVIEAMSAKPAQIFGLDDKGQIREGYDADLVLVDTSNIREITVDQLHSKAGWTPFEGRKGIFPELVLSRGEVVYDGEIAGKKGRGKFLRGKGYVEG